MKVCLINNLYGKNAVGGAERVVQTRAFDYQKKGNEVFIITTKVNKKPDIEKKVEAGITIYYVYIPNIFYYKDLVKHSFVLKLIWHLIDVFGKNKIIKKILMEEKPDIVETHNLMGITFSQKSIKSKSQKSMRWRHFLHDVQLVEPSGVLPWNHVNDNLMQKIYSGLMKKKFRNVDEVISPSEFLKKFYEERGFFVGVKWVIGPPRHSVSIPPSKGGTNTRYLFVGSLVEHKGIRVLMRAWDRFCHSERTRSDSGVEVAVPAGRQEESPSSVQLQGDPSTPASLRSAFAQDDAELHIVGDGILRDEVEKWARNKDNVKVYGRLEGKDLEEIYNNCDTLIFPSTCLENNPTVIHEAHEHGLRVIASDTGGVREIVSENDILVEPGNVEELAGKI